jgi:predicted HTH transcriptional regulator
MDKVIAKALCGFMNSGGGTLVVGVDDEGKALGLSYDFSTLAKDKENEDGFESAFSDIVKNYLELAYRQNISDFRFEDYEGKRICIVQVEQSREPVFCTSDQGRELYVRVGNSTRRLDAKETTEYVKERFKEYWEG